MRKLILFAFAFASLMLSSCSENYSNGERIGLVTQFSQSGIIFKSHEGHLNMTQTGMNSSTPFDFSIDNDDEDPELVKTIDSAAQYGWKVKLVYHETMGKNWFKNRGETEHFITKCEVLDKSPIHSILDGNKPSVKSEKTDTIYVVIDKSKE